MKIRIKRRNIELALLFGLICAAALSMARFDAACDSLRGGVLRLHIRANSDSAEDQAVKIAVRDALLEETDEIFLNSSDLSSAEKSAQENTGRLTAAANRVLAEKGFEYTASVEIGDAYFENRDYDGFTLPAGTYRSLIVRLGNGGGKNWWCVVFPAVCVPAAEARLSDGVPQSACDIAEQPQKYVMRFKTVEIFEDLKHFLDGK